MLPVLFILVAGVGFEGTNGGARACFGSLTSMLTAAKLFATVRVD